MLKSLALKKGYDLKMSNVCEKFLRYVAVDTQSDPQSSTSPSSAKQFDLAKLLKGELEAMGAKDVKLDEYGYVYAEIPTNVPEKNLPAIGFVAHMDTSPDASGKDVKYRIIKNYDCSDIVLNDEKNIVMKTSDFSSLLDHKGKTLIVTDGTTLLGADDKAGVAEIMQLAENLINSDFERPTVKIAFTPDEEVGAGTDHFDVEGFNASLAYTVDGGALGELEFENFNAATATVEINGIGIHPGSAKNKMLNSQEVAFELHSMLPAFKKPEHTEGYEGFFHLNNISGSMEKTSMIYIIRDHDREKFEELKQYMRNVADYLNAKYPSKPISLKIEDSYYNMKEILKDHMEIVDTMKEAMRNVGVEPLVMPIRGGTDGARLSFMGLPCPNICTGGYNCHGPFEYAVVESMEKTVEILTETVKLYSK